LQPISSTISDVNPNVTVRSGLEDQALIITSLMRRGDGALLLAHLSLRLKRINEFPTGIEQRGRILVVIPDWSIPPVETELSAAGRVLPFAAE
jgi:hypothetical protein